jgi:hypothetical protein
VFEDRDHRGNFDRVGIAFSVVPRAQLLGDLHCFGGVAKTDYGIALYGTYLISASRSGSSFLKRRLLLACLPGERSSVEDMYLAVTVCRDRLASR